MALTANTIATNMNAATTLNQKISDLMNKNSKTTNLNDLTKNMQEMGKDLLGGNSLLDKYINNFNTNNNNKTAGITSISQMLKQSSNVSILQASANVSLTSGNNSQALFFQCASARIEESLSYSFSMDDKGNEILSFSYTQNIELEYLHVSANGDNLLNNINNNSSNTANNLLKYVSDILNRFRENNVSDFNKNVTDSTQKFIDSVRQGINKGYEETKGILESLKVFNENIEKDLLNTMNLLEKGLNKLAK